MALFANFLAPYDADQRFDTAIYVPPQPIYLVDDGKIYPHILGLTLDHRPRDVAADVHPGPHPEDPGPVLRPAASRTGCSG